MVMHMLDTNTTSTAISPEIRQSILEQVIDQLNREYSGATLRSPEVEERQAIQGQHGRIFSPKALPGDHSQRQAGASGQRPDQDRRHQGKYDTQEGEPG